MQLELPLNMYVTNSTVKIIMLYDELLMLKTMLRSQTIKIY